MNVNLILKRARDRDNFRAGFTRGWTTDAIGKNFSAWMSSRLSGAFFDGHPWSDRLNARDLRMLSNAKTLKLSLDSASKASVFSVRAELEYNLNVPGRVVDGRDNEKCSELLWAEESSVVWSILNTLAVGDQIRIAWIPNGYSNEFISRAGLNADVINLEVRRGDKLLKFVLHQNTLPVNSGIRSIQPKE